MKQNQIILVIGKKGSGKSYLVKNTLLEVSEPYVIVDTMAEYTRGTIADSLDEFIDLVANGVDDKLIARFTSDDEIEDLFNAAFLMNPHTLIVEEIHRFCNVHYISPGLNRLIRFGRHKSINIIGITQRPFDIPKIMVSMIDHLFLFQIQEPRDLDYLYKITGSNKILSLNKLEVGKYIHINL